MNSSGRFTVLVVEDEPLLRMDLGEELRTKFQVVEATNGEEALTVLRNGMKVDLVCTDVQMPGALDGLALARTVKTDFPEIIVSITSGSAEALDAARTLTDPKLVFAKPFDPRAAMSLRIQLNHEAIVPHHGCPGINDARRRHGGGLAGD